MDKTSYLKSKLNGLKQEYKSLTKSLDKEPQKYDTLNRRKLDALHCCYYPQRIHMKCSCGNDRFYRCNKFICSKCFQEYYLDSGWEAISSEEKIICYGIEVKAEES